MGFLSTLKKNSCSLICMNNRPRDSQDSPHSLKNGKSKSLSDPTTLEVGHDNITVKSASGEEPEPMESTLTEPAEEPTNDKVVTKVSSEQPADKTVAGDAASSDKSAVPEQTDNPKLSEKSNEEGSTNEHGGAATQVSPLKEVSPKKPSKNSDVSDQSTSRETTSENSATKPAKAHVSSKEQSKPQKPSKEAKTPPETNATEKDSLDSSDEPTYLCCGLGV